MGRTDEQHPQPSGGSDTDRTDLQVSVAKEEDVYKRQGRYTDCVDELVFKVINAPTKRMKIEYV